MDDNLTTQEDVAVYIGITRFDTFEELVAYSSITLQFQGQVMFKKLV